MFIGFMDLLIDLIDFTAVEMDISMFEDWPWLTRITAHALVGTSQLLIGCHLFVEVKSSWPVVMT